MILFTKAINGPFIYEVASGIRQHECVGGWVCGFVRNFLGELTSGRGNHGSKGLRNHFYDGDNFAPPLYQYL